MLADEQLVPGTQSLQDGMRSGMADSVPLLTVWLTDDMVLRAVQARR